MINPIINYISRVLIVYHMELVNLRLISKKRNLHWTDSRIKIDKELISDDIVFYRGRNRFSWVQEE